MKEKKGMKIGEKSLQQTWLQGEREMRLSAITPNTPSSIIAVSSW